MRQPLAAPTRIAPGAFTTPLNLGMVVANVVGIALYLWGASHGRTIPEERAAGITTVTGEPIIWAMFVLPVWAAFALVNLGWTAATLARQQWRNAVPMLTVAALWVVAILVDYSQH